MNLARFNVIDTDYTISGIKAWLGNGSALHTGEAGPFINTLPASLDKLPGRNPIACAIGMNLCGWPYGAATASAQAADIPIADEAQDQPESSSMSAAASLDDAIEIVESPEPQPHGRLDIVVFANGGSEILDRISTEPLVGDDILLPLVAAFKESLEPSETPRKFSMTYTRLSDTEIDYQWRDWLGEIERPEREEQGMGIPPEVGPF